MITENESSTGSDLAAVQEEMNTYEGAEQEEVTEPSSKPAPEPAPETPVVEEEAAPPDELDEVLPPETSAAEEAKRGKTARERIAELTRKLRATEEEVQALRKDTSEPATPSSATQELKEPDPEDFAEGYLDDAYIKANAEFAAKKRTLELSQVKEEARQAVREEMLLQSYQKQWQAHHEKGGKLYKDYQETLDTALRENALDCSPAAAEILVQSEYAPQILYTLAKNPDQALDWARLPEHKQVYELARMEAEYSSKSTATTPPASTHTRARPIPEIRTLSSGVVENMPMESIEDYAVFERQANKYLQSSEI